MLPGLGGLQVSGKGDLANWMIPKRGIGSIGGGEWTLRPMQNG
ncbi:MAG: hypothetical protein CM1200mP39_00180 [Dehalococcoidia bacterium]|nr:MAG: hypothetical protein CM1200mP39_00180 [Dehalococcoidia bacterium]